ncbi:uncharacterized protein LOC141674013 [Apium graveolens]|uniref:uncharacterized protein LOC141674013 n=1 Tax=Apium graveolens TaxID=4045 RepID=UPI003D7957FD
MFKEKAVLPQTAELVKAGKCDVEQENEQSLWSLYYILTMDRTNTPLADLYAKLSIAEEEEGGIIVGTEEIQENRIRFVLVAKVLTEKIINFNAMQNVLAVLWRPKEGMENVLVYSRVTDLADPRTVPLEEVDIWVQVYDIPPRFMSENILQSVGDYIGKFVKSDPSNFDGLWKAYVRVRVTINVLKPIKRRMKIKKEGGSWSWINFKYERLSTFCFVCGILGHTERECSVVYANPDKEVEWAYGVWLRAPNRNAKQNTGARWLRNFNGENSWTGYGGRTSTQTGGSNQEITKAKFQEMDGVVHEMHGDNGILTVAARNQGDVNAVTNIATTPILEEVFKYGERVVIDPKRRRVDIEGNKNNIGPIHIQTDGPEGDGGGLALLWKNEGGVGIKGSCNHYIDFEVACEQVGRWRYTGLYGCPERSRRRESWNMLRDLATRSSLPWCVIGDINDMMYVHEKEGGRVQPRFLLEGFKDAVCDCRLLDLGFVGNPFTWEKSRGTALWVQERLDRGLVTQEWKTIFPSAEVRLKQYRSRRDAYGVQKYDEIRWDFLKLLEQQEVYWKQRAKQLWLREGDQNSKYFHNFATGRRRNNLLKGLENKNGVWKDDIGGMQEIIVDYFSELFQASPVTDHLSQREKVQTVTEQQNADLLMPITSEELKGAVDSMHPEKSTGCDGLNPGFYQAYWNIVGKDVVEFCQYFFNTGELPAGVNNTLVCLIPKVKMPRKMTDLRPISLCNVLIRIISKVMENRLKTCLSGLISDKQSAFVEGRLLTDNALIAFEVNHYIKRRTLGVNGIAGLKIDVSKAYDRLEWDYIEHMLNKFGFNPTWIGRVMGCVKTVSYGFWQNGTEFGDVKPQRGIRQGDPISPYLYILCAEGLSSILRRHEEAGLIHGCIAARGAPSISHLLFADDCYLFFKATKSEATTMKNVLRRYERISGQAINFNKSSVIFSPNTTVLNRQLVCEALEVGELTAPGKYLGVPMIMGRNRSNAFKPLIGRVEQRLQGWANKSLSKGGKVVLLKTSAQSIPNFLMNLLLVPAEVCEEIQKKMNGFWWGNGGSGKGIRWMAWERMCVTKKVGFRELRKFNIAMLAKQG